VILHAACRPAALAALAVSWGCASSGPVVFQSGPLPADTRVAVLPFMNYTERQDASDRLMPVLLAQLVARPDLELASSGEVEAVIAQEPWLLLDRIPADILDRFGAELDARALLVGSVLAYGYREFGSERVPEFSVVLRLLETPGGKSLWSISYSRDGRDRERVFGIGRIESLDRLVEDSIREILATLPSAAAGATSGARRST
jgi:hypothetical protein